MLKMLTCPSGHRWGYLSSARSTVSGSSPLCPVCGAPANPASADAGTRIIQQATAPTLQNLGKASCSGTPVLDAIPPFDERVTLVLPAAVPPNMDEQPTLALQEDATVGEPLGVVDPLGPPQLADYEILRELGRGGMGVVYQARQKSLQRMVALKMILAGSHARAEDRERFQTEAQAIARLQHPNIVRIHEVGEAEGRPFLSLEYVDGGSLAHRLNGTPLPPHQAARLVAVMARAVEAAHQQGLVHRDLKPSNILLHRKSEIR